MGGPEIGAQGGRMRGSMWDVEERQPCWPRQREGQHQDKGEPGGRLAVVSDRKNSCRTPEEGRRKGHPGH